MVGSVLDYADTLTDTGFKIVNPNAKNSCGCGESFAA
jgi:iron-sulfur cluster assembly accessory protein